MSTDTAARRLHLWSGLIITGVFVAGFVAGAGMFTWLRPTFHQRRFPPRGPHGPGGILAELRELNLTPDQQRKAEAIVQKNHDTMESIIKETFPRMREAREQVDRELRAILTDDQAKKFDEIRVRRPPEPWKRPGRFERPGFGQPPGRPPSDSPPPPKPAQ